jgi:3',5'-cyclic-nucleotide phosphodiesterase
VAPLVRQGKLRGIFAEISYPDERNASHLYGHLTPRWLLAELHVLAALVEAQRPTAALQGLTIIVSHIKPTLRHVQGERAQIIEQVHTLNDLGLRFVFPEQGDRLTF